MTPGTLEEILGMWRSWQTAQGLSERTITERSLTVRRLLAFTGADPLALSPLDIVGFVGAGELSRRTRWTYHQCIRSYCQWLVRAELRADDPTARIPAPKHPKGTPRPIGDAQLKTLLAVANRRRTRAYILLAALAGLRVHEIAKIRGDDFDLDGRTVTVDGKGGKVETIPLHAVLAEEARRWPRTGYWFASYAAETSAEGHVGRQAISKAIRDTSHRAGFSCTAHQLRHWYASSLLEQGVDIRVVQKLMRHESIQSTENYTRVSGRRERAGLDLLELPADAIKTGA